MAWKIVNNKIGRAGGRKERFAKQTAWDAKYGEDNWIVGYKIDGQFCDKDKALDLADGPSLNSKTRREGLVFKGVNGKLSFKVILNWYLLKHSDR